MKPGFAVSVAFVILTISQPHFANLDHEILAFAAEHRTETLTSLGLVLADVGNTLGMFLLSVMAVIILVALKRSRDGLMLAMIMVIGSSANAILKELLQVPRPEGYEPLGPRGGFSYPSGHAQAAMAYFGTLSLLFRRLSVVGPALLMIIGICACRVYLGVHRPTDVLAGMLLAATVIAFVTSLRCNKGVSSCAR